LREVVDSSSVSLSVKGLSGLVSMVVVLALPTSAAAAVRCGVKTNPPYGGSYDAFNLPSPPGTYNVYYSFWSSPVPYYARRREADGTIRYETLRSNGGQWDFANCTNGICTNAERRTQLQNSNGAQSWTWWIEAWNTTSTSDC
jgi:hypothetical protein